MAQVLSAFHLHPWSSRWCLLFDSTSPLSTSSSSSCLSPSSSSTWSCSLSSSTRRTWQTCAAPRRTRVRTLLTSSHPPTGSEPNLLTFDELYDSSVPFFLMIPSADQDVDDLTLGRMLTSAHRGQVDYCVPGGMSVSQSSSSVMFDGSRQPDSSDLSGQPDVTLGVIRAHNNLSENIRIEQTHDRPGQPDERNSSNAQIRTLLEEQRQTIIAEYREKVGHHELQAAHAEEERQLLQGKLWRQKLEFRDACQQSLTEMEELRKFQSSTFDTIARRKLIEHQNTILELSGRVQELQNEVNCINDSKDVQDAESVRSGNSHVTSRPVLCPPHPILEGMLRHSFITPSRREGPPSIWDTHGTSGNVFANPDASSSAPYLQELHQSNSSIEEPLHSSTVEKSERPESRSEMPVRTVNQGFSHLQFRRPFK